MLYKDHPGVDIISAGKYNNFFKEKSLLKLIESSFKSLNEILSCINELGRVLWFYLVNSEWRWFSEWLSPLGLCLKFSLCLCVVAHSWGTTFLNIFFHLFLLSRLWAYIWSFLIFYGCWFWIFLLTTNLLWPGLIDLTDRRLFGKRWRILFALGTSFQLLFF